MQQQKQQQQDQLLTAVMQDGSQLLRLASQGTPTPLIHDSYIS
jgi:hypothetical protein